MKFLYHIDMTIFDLSWRLPAFLSCTVEIW